MKRILIILLCTISIVFGACEKLLDKEPTDKLSIEDVFKDVSGAKTALAGGYRGLLNTEHYQRNTMVYTDLLAGNIKYSKSTNNSLEDVYNFNQTPTESSFNSTYSTLYSELNNINNIIFYTPNASGSDLDKAQIVGEAKCLRALLHFDLVRIYARPFNFTTDGSHLGIVINLKPQLYGDAAPVRSTVAETYKAIISDLTDAINTFDNNNVGILSNGNKQNYFTKASAQALLAKVYLNANQWDNAYNMADTVIKNGLYTLISNSNYVASWTGVIPSVESVLEIPTSITDTGNSLGTYYDVSNTTYRQYAATSDLTSLFSSTDIRRGATMFNSLTISGINYFFTKKYAAGGANATPVKILRLSELYLIRAEAATEKTNPDFAQANTDLNLIRKRGDASASTLNLAVKADLIDAILLERRKELAFEGNLLFDLLRKKKDIVRVDATATVKNLTTNDPKLIMPLPATTVNANINMVQNPGY